MYLIALCVVYLQQRPALKPTCFLFVDAFFTTAKPESAITDISEHEWQFQTGPASQQSMYPNQYQL